MGDLPTAYIVVEPDDSPQQALERYCEMMEEWISAVRDGGSLQHVFSVSADRRGSPVEGRPSRRCAQAGLSGGRALDHAPYAAR